MAQKLAKIGAGKTGEGRTEAGHMQGAMQARHGAGTGEKQGRKRREAEWKQRKKGGVWRGSPGVGGWQAGGLSMLVLAPLGGGGAAGTGDRAGSRSQRHGLGSLCACVVWNGAANTHAGRTHMRWTQKRPKGTEPFGRLNLVAKGGIEPPTQGFSVLCSTN